MFYFEFGSVKYGEFLLAPGFVPINIAVETVLGVINPILKLTDFRKKTASAFKVYRADAYVARSLFVTEKSLTGGCENLSVVLCNNVVEHGKM